MIMRAAATVLPSVKLGKALRFDEEDVNGWLKALSLQRAA